MIPSASSFRASTVFSQYQMVFQLKRQQAFERTHLRIFCESQQVAFLVLQFLVLAHTWFALIDHRGQFQLVTSQSNRFTSFLHVSGPHPTAARGTQSCLS